MKPIDQWIYTSFRSGEQGSGYQTYQSTEGISRPEEEELADVTRYSSDPNEVGGRATFGIRRLRSSSDRWVVFTACHSKDEGGRGNYFVHALVGKLEDFKHDPFLLYNALLSDSPLFRAPLSREEAMGTVPKQALHPILGDSIEVNVDWAQRIQSHLRENGSACPALVSKVLAARKARPLLMVGEEEAVLCAFALLWQVCLEGDRSQLSCMTLLPSRNRTEFIITGWPEALGRPSADYLDRFSGVYTWSSSQPPPPERPLLLDVQKWQDVMPSVNLPPTWKPKQTPSPRNQTPLSENRTSQSRSEIDGELNIDDVLEMLSGNEITFLNRLEWFNEKLLTVAQVNALEKDIMPRMHRDSWGWYRWIMFRHMYGKLDGVSNHCTQQFLNLITEKEHVRRDFTRYFVKHQADISSLQAVLNYQEAVSLLIVRELVVLVERSELDPCQLAKTSPKWAGAIFGEICARLRADDLSWKPYILDCLVRLSVSVDSPPKMKVSVGRGFISALSANQLSSIPIEIAWVLLQLSVGSPQLCELICPKLEERNSDLAKMLNQQDIQKLALPPGYDLQNWRNVNAIYHACQLYGTAPSHDSIQAHAEPLGKADVPVRSVLFRIVILHILVDGVGEITPLIQSLIEINQDHGDELSDLTDKLIHLVAKENDATSKIVYDRSVIQKFIDRKLPAGRAVAALAGPAPAAATPQFATKSNADNSLPQSRQEAGKPVRKPARKVGGAASGTREADTLHATARSAVNHSAADVPAVDFDSKLPAAEKGRSALGRSRFAWAKVCAAVGAGLMVTVGLLLVTGVLDNGIYLGTPGNSHSAETGTDDPTVVDHSASSRSSEESLEIVENKFNELLKKGELKSAWAAMYEFDGKINQGDPDRYDRMKINFNIHAEKLLMESWQSFSKKHGEAINEQNLKDFSAAVVERKKSKDLLLLVIAERSLMDRDWKIEWNGRVLQKFPKDFDQAIDIRKLELERQLKELTKVADTKSPRAAGEESGKPGGGSGHGSKFHVFGPTFIESLPLTRSLIDINSARLRILSPAIASSLPPRTQPLLIYKTSSMTSLAKLDETQSASGADIKTTIDAAWALIKAGKAWEDAVKTASLEQEIVKLLELAESHWKGLQEGNLSAAVGAEEKWKSNKTDLSQDAITCIEMIGSELKTERQEKVKKIQMWLEIEPVSGDLDPNTIKKVGETKTKWSMSLPNSVDAAFVMRLLAPPKTSTPKRR